MQKFFSKYMSPSSGQKASNVTKTILTLAAILILGILCWNVYSIKSDFAKTKENFEQRLSILQSELATSSKAREELALLVAEQQNRSEDLDDTLDDIADTVGTLEKLSKTDRELLQKYSKVYFLNENYVPTRLTSIDNEFLYDKTKTMQFHGIVLPYLTRMLESAARDNVTIQVVSAYRSFGTQAAVKSGYITTYGSGANSFSAEQGYSEHQLGTAVDLGAPGTNTLLTIGFENTEAFKWMQNNAYRYGFILSYPRGNTYYQYEPWHWRFVGEKLARYLHNQNKNFYDLDQRTIDTYLANIFD